MVWGAAAVLRDRNARLCLGGVVVSGFGTSALWLVAGIWVKDLTGSDALAALTAFTMWAPMLIAPLLGAVADRVRRRPLLIALDLASAALLLPLLLVDSADRIWLLFTVLVLYGVCGVIHDAAETALVPSVVGDRLLGDFNGLRLTANEGTKLLAPLLAAGLFAAYGGAPVVLADIATFLAAAWLFLLLRIREPGPARARGGTAEGLRVIRRSPAVRPLILAGSVTMLLAGVNGALIHSVADSVLDRSPAFVGVLYAAQGAGSVLTGLLTGPLLRRIPEHLFAAAGTALFAIGAGARSLPSDAVALAASTAVGLGLPCVLVAAMTAVQRHTPERSLGRTAATASTLLYAPNAVALALGAGLITVLDVRTILPVVGVAGLITALLLARTPARRPDRGTGTPRPVTSRCAPGE
ncbi:MFS transporter [Streptomyces sp. NPDC006798]|uniref:MFS transporter n=1 Tax=Streptomyces sp. NPDC006798 TaxID=3155462 RepID=UPI0033C5D831